MILSRVQAGWLLTLAVLVMVNQGIAQEPVFSGPQPGEKTTGFKVLDVTGLHAGKEVDYLAEWKGAPTVLVFLHGLERSMLPFIRVVDEYGFMKRETLRTLAVFLTDDRLSYEQRLPIIRNSIRMQAPMVISLDGAEGPGNYGLNKKCLVTVIVARDNTVAANFALVQPGIVDAPKVIAAIAKLIGDTNPPTAERLEELRRARTEAGPDTARPAASAPRNATPMTDLNKFDLNTVEGLKGALRALQVEIESLRRELVAARGQQPVPPRRPNPTEPLPGAAPTDARLLGLLRSFIQPTNDNARVDSVLKEVAEYVKGNADLTKQAIDGWVRVLHLKYGTEYAQKSGTELVEKLRK